MPLEYLVDDKFLARMDSQLAGWSDPVMHLRQALAKDGFALYCQPILSLQGPERYPMAEVLVRMREEERAMLPPGEFLPAFEHFRMMPQLDRWVLRNVLKRLAAGSRVPRFSVNLSGQTLEDPEFPQFVIRALTAAAVPARAVLFEIDESDALTRPESAARFAAAMKAVGVGVALDGFGRRAVSFMPLKTLQAEFVKVDGSITRKLLVSGAALTKLNAIVRVSEALGIGSVAEFVEEQDVLLRLKALGVGYAQGFGVYQPHPIDSIATQIAE